MPFYEPLELRRLMSALPWGSASPWFPRYSSEPVSALRVIGQSGATVVATTMPKASPGSMFATPLADPFDGPAVAPFTPAQVRHFYGVDQLNFGAVAGDGAGQTIAIVDAYHNPKFVDRTSPSYSTSDLAVFDQRFGLPDPPSFKRIAQDGSTNLPTGYSSIWALETALDVEWAHAMAPAASILLVEASSDSLNDLLSAAATTAKNYPGVVTVSMSFGQTEYPGIQIFNGTFTSGTQPVTFVASTGDQGAESTAYPSFAPNVLAVGGTAITTTDSNASYGSETVWSDAQGATGGAFSQYEPRPEYQVNTSTGSTTNRAVPDVSLLAAPSTGVYVRDSSQSGGQWFKVGGTSLSAPCWAGLIAVADQGRTRLGLSPLDGRAGTLSRLYRLPSSDFNDVVTGYNGYGGASGYFATAGYDPATGLGTPKAQSLIPDLAGGATVAGRVYADYDADGAFDHTDAAIGGQQIYLDLNDNRVHDTAEPMTVTDSTGRYQFADRIGHEPGTVRLFGDLTGGAYNYVAYPSGQALATRYGATDTVDIGYFPTLFTDANSYTLRLSPDGSSVQVIADGVTIQSSPRGSATSYTFGGNSLTIDGTNGNPVPAGGVTSTAPALTVIDSSATDTLTVTSTVVGFDGNAINYPVGTTPALSPAAGSVIAIQSGSATIPPAAFGAGIRPVQLSSLTITAAGRLTIAPPSSSADRTVLSATALSVSGILDLTTNDLIAHTGSTAAVVSSYADGLHALGSAFSIGQSFDGLPTAVGDVLVKYTYRGDANLDGKIDGSDYARIDFGYLSAATGWSNGDFNADGSVDGSDYSLIDNAYNRQSTPL